MCLFRSDGDDDDCPPSCIRKKKKKSVGERRVRAIYVILDVFSFSSFTLSVGRLRIVELTYVRICSIGDNWRGKERIEYN